VSGVISITYASGKGSGRLELFDTASLQVLTGISLKFVPTAVAWFTLPQSVRPLFHRITAVLAFRRLFSFTLYVLYAG